MAPELVTTPANPVHVALDLAAFSSDSAGRYLDGLLKGFDALQSPIVWTMIGEEREVPAGLEIHSWVRPPDPDRRGPSSRKRIDLRGVDVLHTAGAPGNTLRAPRVLATIHDLIDVMAAPWHRRLSRRFALRRLASREVRIIAASEKVRDDLELLVPSVKESVWLIHPGPGRASATASAPSGLQRRGPREVKDKRWLMTLGPEGPLGNMPFLVSAMALWYRRRPSAPPLLWITPDESAADRRWTSIAARARSHIRVIVPESSNQLEQLLRETAAVVVPDLEKSHAYEALEIMSRGIPVICARRRPFTDLLGEAPLWFDPQDSSTLWRALDALLDDPMLRYEMSARSQREAAKYDWMETAEMTMGAYRQLVRSIETRRS